MPAEYVDVIFDTGRSMVKGEKALQMYDAYETITQKRLEAMEKAPTPEVFRSVEELREKYPNAGYTYSASAGGYVPTYQKPETVKASDYTTVVNYLSKFKYARPEVFEKIKTGLQKQFPHLDLSAITQESLREPQKEEEPETRATSLTTLEKYREKILNADSWEEAQNYINDYVQAGYDATQLNITQEDWINTKKADLDNLMAVLNEITAGTPEGRNIKGAKEFTFEVDGKAVTKTGEEWYKDIYESYTALLDLLEKMGIDTSQYKRLKPPSEVQKAGTLKGWFTGGGVTAGDLIDIYY